MNREVNYGDIVYLKSGSPAMTVESKNRLKEYAECVWIDGNGQQHSEKYFFHSLTHEKPNY